MAAPEPPPGRGRVRDVFLRLLGVIFLAAFLSLLVQVRLLFGRDGLLPAAAYLDAHGVLAVPTLFWLDASDRALVELGIAGAVLSFGLILNVAPRWCLLALWALYLSFVSVGQDFLSFQWDNLLHALRHAGRAETEASAAAAPDRGVPHALARLPHELRVGRRQAPDRRSHLARPERDGDLLRDGTAADVGGLVRPPAPGMGAAPVGRLHPARRARPHAARLGSAPRAPRRVRRHGRDAGDHPAHRQLRLLQLPQRGAGALHPRRPRPRLSRRTPRPPAPAVAAARPEPGPDGPPGRRRRDPRAALGDPLPALPRGARGRPGASRDRHRPDAQRVPPLRAHDPGPEGGRHRGERGRRDLGALRVPLQAGRPHAAAAVRGAAPAARRLPAVVPAPRRAAARPLLPPPPRAAADRARGGRAALRTRPLPGDAARAPARRLLPLPLHRRRDAPRDRRLVEPRAARLLAAPPGHGSPLTPAMGRAY